jgi:hypothetical protein
MQLQSEVALSWLIKMSGNDAINIDKSLQSSFFLCQRISNPLVLGGIIGSSLWTRQCVRDSSCDGSLIFILKFLVPNDQTLLKAV